MANFKEAIKVVLKHEGGYVNDPKDAGGETNYGISKRSYPNVDIKNLTVAKATDIYYNDFWLPNKFDSIVSDKVAQKCFDTAVNMGSKRAIMFMQQVCNKINTSTKLVVDGAIGPKTLASVNSISEDIFLEEFREIQKDYYITLVERNPDNVKFLRGWLKRAAS